jgi:hypothetical protein
MDSWWISWPVGGLLDLEFCAKNFLVTLPQIFCMAKRFMALYVKWLFPYKKVCAQGSKRHFWVCGGNFCPE